MQFIKSATKPSEYPEGFKYEVALVGRSNSGKSSLINALAQQRVAKVSSMPGKTTLLNFFDAGDYYRLVDMPGYGFAQRSHGDQKGWRNVVETYLATRELLAGLVLVMDIRRDWSEDERDLLSWIAPRGLPVALVLNKGDKLSKSQVTKRRTLLKEESGLDMIWMTSALKRSGVEELEESIFDLWIKPRIR